MEQGNDKDDHLGRIYRTVYILFKHDSTHVPRVVEVFADMQDANNECLLQAYHQGISLTNDSSTTGPNSHLYSPIEPLRWDTPEGLSCWVEGFEVVPRRIPSPARSQS